MQRMHLDFANLRRPAGMSGWSLLLAGLVCAAAVVAWERLHWQPLNAAGTEKLRTLRTAIELRRPPAPKLDDAQLVTEWTRAMAVTDELNLPWEQLFATFEAEGKRHIGILSLEPDAGKRRLVLIGEARNFGEMLAYYRLLQQQEIFSGLTLHTHQINQQDREKPVRFRVTSKWMANS